MLADFVVDCIEANWELGSSDGVDKEDINRIWIVMVDSSSREQGVGTGEILISLEGVEVFYEIRFEFKATNN